MVSDQIQAVSSNAFWLTPLIGAILGSLGGWLTVVFTMGRYQEKINHLKEEKDRAAIKLDCLRTDVDKLNEFKINAQKFIDQNIYKAQSVLQLTEFGRAMVKDSGFAEIFEKEKANLAAQLADKKPATKYDVQEKARALLDDLTEYPAFASIKSYAFASGKDTGQILRAGAILLRDYYLEIHPEVKN